MVLTIAMALHPPPPVKTCPESEQARRYTEVRHWLVLANEVDSGNYPMQARVVAGVGKAAQHLRTEPDAKKRWTALPVDLSDKMM